MEISFRPMTLISCAALFTNISYNKNKFKINKNLKFLNQNRKKATVLIVQIYNT